VKYSAEYQPPIWLICIQSTNRRGHRDSILNFPRMAATVYSACAKVKNSSLVPASSQHGPIPVPGLSNHYECKLPELVAAITDLYLRMSTCILHAVPPVGWTTLDPTVGCAIKPVRTGSWAWRVVCALWQEWTGLHSALERIGLYLYSVLLYSCANVHINPKSPEHTATTSLH